MRTFTAQRRCGRLGLLLRPYAQKGRGTNGVYDTGEIAKKGTHVLKPLFMDTGDFGRKFCFAILLGCLLLYVHLLIISGRAVQIKSTGSGVFAPELRNVAETVPHHIHRSKDISILNAAINPERLISSIYFGWLPYIQVEDDDKRCSGGHEQSVFPTIKSVESGGIIDRQKFGYLDYGSSFPLSHYPSRGSSDILEVTSHSYGSVRRKVFEVWERLHVGNDSGSFGTQNRINTSSCLFGTSLGGSRAVLRGISSILRDLNISSHPLSLASHRAVLEDANDSQNPGEYDDEQPLGRRILVSFILIIGGAKLGLAWVDRPPSRLGWWADRTGLIAVCLGFLLLFAPDFPATLGWWI